MTMLALTILGIAGLVGLAGLLARDRVRRNRWASDLRDQFYRDAELLAREDRVPTSIIDLLHFLMRNVHSHTLLPRMICRVVFSASPAPSERGKQLLTDIKALSPELAAVLYRAVGSCMLALTLNHLVLGWLVRHAVLWAFEPARASTRDKARAEAIVGDVASLSCLAA